MRKDQKRTGVLRLLFNTGAPPELSGMDADQLTEHLLLFFTGWLNDAVISARPTSVVIEVDCTYSGKKLTEFSEIWACAKKAVGSQCGLSLFVVTDGSKIDKGDVEFMSKEFATAVIDLNKLSQIKGNCEATSRSDNKMESVEFLQRAHRSDLIGAPIIRWVLDGNEQTSDLFFRLTEDLGLCELDLRLPSVAAGNLDLLTSRNHAKQLAKVLERSAYSRPNGFYVSMYDLFFRIMGTANGGTATAPVVLAETIIKVYSDGSFERGGGFESLRQSEISSAYDKLPSFCNKRLDEYLDMDYQRYIIRMEGNIAVECEDCAWVGLCRSGNRFGGLVNRYRAESGFSSKSRSCELLESLYLALAEHLIRHGTDSEQIVSALEHLKQPTLTGPG